MLALLRKARVIDDPGFDWPVFFQQRQRHFPDLAQNGIIGPGRLTHKMEKRLVLRRNSRWRRNRRQRFNALALAPGKQARTVIAERTRPVAMTDGFA
jgi:hypothetical protein